MTNADDEFRSWVASAHPEQAEAIRSIPVNILITLYPDVTPNGERYDRVREAADAICHWGRRRRNFPRSTSMKSFNDWIDLKAWDRGGSVLNKVKAVPTSADEVVWKALAKAPYFLPMKQFNAKISNNFFFGAYAYVTQDWNDSANPPNRIYLKGFRLVCGAHGVNIVKNS